MSVGDAQHQTTRNIMKELRQTQVNLPWERAICTTQCRSQCEAEPEAMAKKGEFRGALNRQGECVSFEVKNSDTGKKGGISENRVRWIQE